MNFKSITIQGFRTFIERQTFSISDIRSKSLNYITGDNLIEKSLEGNDVGKSSLFEALCFCLYGTTSTKLRAGDVANWTKSKKCFVQVVFEKNGDTYVLDRQWSPNKLFLAKTENPDYLEHSDKEVTQEQLEDIIGLNFSGFLYSVFISQFTSQFFDLDPMDKLKVFSDMLRLESWLDRSEKAKIKTKEITADIDSIMSEKYKLEGKLDILDGQNYDTDIKTWDFENKEKIKVIKDKYSFLEKVKKDLLVKRKEYESEISSLSSNLSLSKSKVDKGEKEKDKAISSCRKVAEKILLINNDVKNIRETIDKFEGVIDKGICPYCVQKVSVNYLRNQLRNLDVELDTSRTKVKAMTYNKKLLSDKESKASILYTELYDDYCIMKDDLQSIRIELNTVKIKLTANQDSITALNNDFNDAQKKINPYIELKEKNNIKKQEVVDLLNKVENSLEELHKEYSLYDFWIKGFKDIRLFVVAQALQEFEICINNNLHQLGLNEWLIKLSVEREVNKGRSVKRGFSILVQSPYNDGFVSPKCWGGGVSQRLRLAVTMGLIDLIRSRTGVECNIEIWDEPTKFLSEQGIEDLLCVLEDRANIGDKKVFLIDHRKLQSFGGFYNIITITKDKKGSCINQT